MTERDPLDASDVVFPPVNMENAELVGYMENHPAYVYDHEDECWYIDEERAEAIDSWDIEDTHTDDTDTIIEEPDDEGAPCGDIQVPTEHVWTTVLDCRDSAPVLIADFDYRPEWKGIMSYRGTFRLEWDTTSGQITTQFFPVDGSDLSASDTAEDATHDSSHD